MNYFQAIVLGIIQGTTEWLPISSQAMVFLFSRFFFDLGHIEAIGVSVWLHSGTLLAAVIYFWKDILRILGNIFQKDSLSQKVFLFLLLSTLMSGIIAFPLLFFVFLVEIPKALFTIVIGLLLVIIAFLQKKSCGLGLCGKSLEFLKIQDSLIVGMVQGFAALPGFSRSGSTVAMLLFLKYSLKDAFYLSFLMSIPIVFLAQIALPILQKEFIITIPLLVGTLVSGLVGFISIKALMEFAQKVSFFKATLTLGFIVVFLGVILLFLNY